MPMSCPFPFDHTCPPGNDLLYQRFVHFPAWGPSSCGYGKSSLADQADTGDDLLYEEVAATSQLGTKVSRFGKTGLHEHGTLAAAVDGSLCQEIADACPLMDGKMLYQGVLVLRKAPLIGCVEIGFLSQVRNFLDCRN
jgi:hypothetical protein